MFNSKGSGKVRFVALCAALLIACIVFVQPATSAVPPEDPQWKLIQAAWSGRLDEVKDLVSKGASATQPHPSGLTPLQAARAGGRSDVESYLQSAGAASSEIARDPAQVADALLKLLLPNSEPGAAVLVARDGKILLEGGYGYASSDGTPITPDTKFRIGSVTKQFTASAILRLQENGKLRVTDPLSKYIPDFPNGDKITLHHLLTHTSGIHSYTAQPDFLSRVTRPIRSDDLLNEIKTYAPDFEPGTKWSYSNSGYFILGMVVEKVSGTDYGAYLSRVFFEPLGMKSTGVHRAGVTIEPSAIGYIREGDGFAAALDWDMSWAGGAGALYSTVRDLFIWNEAVFGEKVLSPESLQSAFTVPATKEAPTPNPERGYGYGWGIRSFRGAREIQHGGGLHGFASSLLRLPDQKFTVAVLSNAMGLREAEPGNLAHRLAELFLVGQLESQAPRAPKPSAVSVEPEALDAIVGRYDYGRSVLTIRRDGARLLAKMPMQPELEIFPRSETEFFWKAVDAEVRFEKDPAGKVVRAIHRQGGQTVTAPKLPDITAVKLDDAARDALLGDYKFGPHGTLKFTSTGDKLFVQATGQPRFEAVPVSENELVLLDVNARLEVVRDASGKVTKLINHQGGGKFELPKKLP